MTRKNRARMRQSLERAAFMTVVYVAMDEE